MSPCFTAREIYYSRTSGSRKRPPLLSDQFSKMSKVFKSKITVSGTSCKEPRPCFNRAKSMKLGSLSARVFETRTATGSELFSLLTYLHTTEFALPSIFSALEMLGIKIWETPLSWHAKCPLPVVVRVSKTRVLKLPSVFFLTSASDHLTCTDDNRVEIG